MRVIRQLPRPTSIGFSARPFARRFWPATSTPAPGRSIWKRSRLAPGSSEGNTISRVLPRPIPSGGAVGALSFWTQIRAQGKGSAHGSRAAGADYDSDDFLVGVGAAPDRGRRTFGVSRARQRLSASHGAQPGGNHDRCGPRTARCGSDSRHLAARSRSAAGPTAPARGLFLHSVEYDERDFLFGAEGNRAR